VKELAPRQKLFCEEYLIDLNATQAALRAGYSEKTAHSQGPRLLENVEVKAYLAEAMAARAQRTQIDADYVLRRLVEIDQMDVADIVTDDGALRPIREWPKVWRQFISGLEISEIFSSGGEEKALASILKKVKWPDKLKNLELIGRHNTVSAFADNLRHNHTFTDADGNPITGITITVKAVEPGAGGS
jgi:phage terminase small subunit